MNMNELKKLPLVSEQDVQDDNVTLKDNEYLFKLDMEREVGFMTKMNKNGTIPMGFKSWNQYGSKLDVLILTEDYRKGWEIVGIRNGTSTPWVQLRHPFGFIVEINVPGFTDMITKVTIVESFIENSCYFDAKNKKLLVK